MKSILGKLATTNGVSISVKDRNGFRGQHLENARLLKNDGNAFFNGELYVSRANFINSTKETIVGWMRACNRSEDDIRGPAGDRNTIYFFRDEDGRVNLHFAEAIKAVPPG